MNVFSAVILAALIVEFTLGLAANLLNLRSLTAELPPALEGFYHPDSFRKSQEYTRVNTRFGLVVRAFSLVILLAFWFTGGFNYFDQMVRSWGFVTIINGLLYTGILLLAYHLVMLPFSVYGTFVIEERFGFNRTRGLTFFLDEVKGTGLALVLGAPLLAAVLALFEYAGAFAWLYCWAAVTLVSLAVQYIAPTWIMPLFNRFKPLESGDLKNQILKYAYSVDFPVKHVMVMDGSRRSSRSNAFFTGFGRNKRIALFDTLIEKHDIPEIVAVLAHEIGHYKKKHVIQGTVIGILHTGVIFFLLSLFLGSPGLYRAFYMENMSVYAGLLFFGLLYAPIELVLSIGLQMFSRKNEYEADLFAAKTVEEPKKLVAALKKLYTTNLSNLTPHPFYVFLNYSHPPLLDRIQAIEAQSKPG